MLEKFQTLNLMRTDSDNFKITKQGYDIVDEFWSIRILKSIKELQASTSSVDEKELANAVTLTNGEADMDVLHRLLKLLRDKGLVTLSITGHGYSSWLTEQGAGFIRPYL